LVWSEEGQGPVNDGYTRLNIRAKIYSTLTREIGCGSELILSLCHRTIFILFFRLKTLTKRFLSQSVAWAWSVAWRMKYCKSSPCDQTSFYVFQSWV
jgi:hypothetical protein